MYPHILDVIPNINEITPLFIYKDTDEDMRDYINDNIMPITYTILNRFTYNTNNCIKGCDVKCSKQLDLSNFFDRKDLIYENDIKILVSIIVCTISIMSGELINGYITEPRNPDALWYSFDMEYNELIKYKDISKQILNTCTFSGSFTTDEYKEYLRYYDIVLVISDYYKSITQKILNGEISSDSYNSNDDEYDEEYDD